MGTVIKEYALEQGARTVVHMQYNAQLLTVKAVNGVPTLCARANLSEPESDRVFVILTAEQAIGDGWLTHIDSYQLDGQLFHAFERDPNAVDEVPE